MALPMLVPAASLTPGLEGGFRIISVKPGLKPAPKSLIQSSSQPQPQSGSLSSVPPLEGPAMQVAITITDQRQGDYDFIATTNVGLTGSMLSGYTTNVIFGQLDSGSSTHLVSYPGAVASGLQGAYLSGNTYTASGVDGSVDLDVSEPVGFFAQGIQDLDAQGNPPPSLMMGQGNFSCMVNTLANYQQGADIPTLIGSPFLLYYPAYIRNSQPVQLPGASMSSPSITFYANPDDTNIPALTHRIFLATQPTGTPAVAYIFGFSGPEPTAPSTILAGLGASALFFTASSVTLHESTNSSSGQMVVDTGAQATLISQIVAGELNLDLQHPDFEVQVQGLVSTVTAPGFYIDSASVPALGGAVNWNNIPVVVLNVPSPDGGTLYGIIGSNLTATRDMVFNGAVFTPYLDVTDPIVPPRIKITAFRLTGPGTGEVDWHAEPAPPVLYLEQCTNLAAYPPTWTPVATNTLGTIDGTLSVTGLVSGSFLRLDAPQ